MIIIKGPVPLISVTNSRMKYEKLIAKARTVKISKTFVIGGWSNAIVRIRRYKKWKKRVRKRNTLFEWKNFLPPFWKS